MENDSTGGESQENLPDKIEGSAEEPAESASPFTDSAGSVSERPRKKAGIRITEEEAEAVYKDWRAGERNLNLLARKHHMTWQTINRLIHFGKPSKGMRSFKDRYALEFGKSRDHAIYGVNEKTAEYIAQAIVGEWERVTNEDRHLVGGMKRVLAHIIDKLKIAIQSLSFTRTIRTKDKAGNPITIQVPLEGNELVLAARAAARAVREIVHTEEILFKVPTGESDPAKEQQTWLDNLTDEQLQHIADTGNIPPGVTDEMIFGRRKAKGN